MSEQSKSNVQALGAGLVGFIAVMAVGGGAMMVHRSLQAKAALRPAAAGAPIDLAAPGSLERPSGRPAREARLESPAPLVGGDDDAPVSAAPSAGTSSNGAAPGAAGAT